MANRLMPRASLCALALVCAACSSDSAANGNGAAGDSAGGASSGAGAASVSANAGQNSATSSSGAASGGGMGSHSGSTDVSAGSAGKSSAGQSDGAPPAVDGKSVYTLECHGDSKDCNLASVPCFGVGSQTPNVAAGWACANRCTSNADCSDAPSGAEARASCVSFTSASHCVLVCVNENQHFACPGGMSCYVPPKSPIGYCLWP
ncbi:MAG TPA: hypothetical protein VFK05_24820 [Polyangiaceae bacterium]|nr:hypothetical protein [Polyangiaceae bacterium]